MEKVVINVLHLIGVDNILIVDVKKKLKLLL